MTVEARVNATVTVNGATAAAELDRVAAGMGRLDVAQRRVASSAGQMRAATANLGQQIGDVAQGLAAGINPATIFAQQAGQVAFAVSGMGGALGKVGTFLSGPWGAALTGAVVILGSLAAAHSRAGDAAARQKLAAGDLTKALGELDRATGFANKSAAESIRLSELAVAQDIEATKKKRDLAKSTLDAAEARLKAAQIDQNEGGGRGANFGSFGVAQTAQAEVARATGELNKLRKTIADAEAASAKSASFGRANLAAKAATDQLERIRQAADAKVEAVKKLGLSEEETTRRLTAIYAEQKAAQDRVSESQKATTAAARAAAKEMRDAAKAAQSYADALARLPGQNSTLIAGLNRNLQPIGNLVQQAAAESAQSRESSGLAASVAAAEASIAARNGRALGNEAAKAFRDGSIADAAAIGNAIGGSLGRAISGFSALGLGTKSGGITSDYTGVGKQLTSLLQPLGNAFGDGGRRFAANVGKAAGGAATGSVISGIGDALGIKNSKTGSQLGGAIGSFIPIPGGEIIGSILGGLVGGLFGVKSGSTTVSASGGKISQSGSGNASVQKATGGLGNTIADALQAVADQLGGEIGTFSVSIGKRGDSFRVDRSGRGKIRGSTVKSTDSESEALSLAIADAIRDGGIKTKSPRVQAVLTQYADNINKAVAEALKVKGLEDLISDRQNPFASAFRSLEEQLKKRVDVARQYGFDLVEIERINGEDRAAALKDTLASATGNIRNLLNDLQFGSRATGSPVERLAGLIGERDRLGVLAKGGDQSAIDAFASIIQQIDDLQKETFGKTAGFATGRADSVALLNDLVKTTEDRIRAAADQARAAADTTNAKLTEANASLDDIAKGTFQTVQSLEGLAKLMAQMAANQLKTSGSSQFART